jgi:hypothetical protein
MTPPAITKRLKGPTGARPLMKRKIAMRKRIASPGAAIERDSACVASSSRPTFFRSLSSALFGTGPPRIGRFTGKNRRGQPLAFRAAAAYPV